MSLGNKYANHPNNIFLREWCSYRGRQTALVQLMYPEMSRSYLGGFVNGEGLFDDDQMKLAKPLMDQIEQEERTGKRKLGGKLKGPSLDTRKRMDRYADVENTVEFNEYADWFQKYAGHHNLFVTKLNFELPMRPTGSNLMNEEFRQNLKKAQHYVTLNNLPIAPVDIGPRGQGNTNSRLHHLQTARLSLHDLDFMNILSPIEEFNLLSKKVSECSKLTLLVPMVFLYNYGAEEDDLDDYDLALAKYNKFINSVSESRISGPIGIMRRVTKHALEMIEHKGWLSDMEEDDEDYLEE